MSFLHFFYSICLVSVYCFPCSCSFLFLEFSSFCCLSLYHVPHFLLYFVILSIPLLSSLPFSLITLYSINASLSSLFHLFQLFSFLHFFYLLYFSVHFLFSLFLVVLSPSNYIPSIFIIFFILVFTSSLFLILSCWLPQFPSYSIPSIFPTFFIRVFSFLFSFSVVAASRYSLHFLSFPYLLSYSLFSLVLSLLLVILVVYSLHIPKFT